MLGARPIPICNHPNTHLKLKFFSSFSSLWIGQEVREEKVYDVLCMTFILIHCEQTFISKSSNFWTIIAVTTVKLNLFWFQTKGQKQKSKQFYFKTKMTKMLMKYIQHSTHLGIHNLVIRYYYQVHMYIGSVALLWHTFESEVRKSLSTLEPCSTDSLDHQHCAKNLSPKIELDFKMLCESKATLP